MNDPMVCCRGLTFFDIFSIITWLMQNKSLEKTVEGTVIETLPSTMFRVDIGDRILLAHLAGKMRMHYIKVMPGDRVLLKLSPDGQRGIITRRF